MTIADAIGARSDCVRKYGAVIVDSRQRIVATGYNGPPSTWRGKHQPIMPDDIEWFDCRQYCPHAREQAGQPSGYHDCFSIHAEANALLFCDRREREGGTIYVTTIPCWDCAKMIANSGLAALCYIRDDAFEYRHGDDVVKLLLSCGLAVVPMTP